MASEAWAEVGSLCVGIALGHIESTASHFVTASIAHSVVVSCSQAESCDSIDTAFAYPSDPCSGRILDRTRRGQTCQHSYFPL